jgi:hypothetical protein
MFDTVHCVFPLSITVGPTAYWRALAKPGRAEELLCKRAEESENDAKAALFFRELIFLLIK